MQSAERDRASCKADFKNVQFVSCTMSGAHSIFHLSLSNKKHLERSREFHYRVTGPYPLMLSLPSGLGLGVQWDLLSREQGRVDPFLWTVLTGLSSCNSVLHFICMTSPEGGALAQAASRQPLTSEARVRSQAGPCGVCVGLTGTGTWFSSNTSGFLYSQSIHLPPTQYSRSK